MKVEVTYHDELEELFDRVFSITEEADDLVLVFVDQCRSDIRIDSKSIKSYVASGGEKVAVEERLDALESSVQELVRRIDCTGNNLNAAINNHVSAYHYNEC